MSTHPSAAVHPSGKHLAIGDTELWVEVEGTGEPLILLAGGPASSHLIFHPIFSALADQYRVIYYDYRGRGRSSTAAPGPASGSDAAPSDPTFAQDVDDLESLRAALGHPTISLYGFSYGGLVAQAYALAYPHRVRRLVLANTLHSPEMWQGNHENLNRELENQHPELWDEILRLRAAGHRSSSPAMQRAFAQHGSITRWFSPEHAERLLSEPGSKNPDLYYRFVGSDIEFIIGGQVAAIPDFRPRLHELQMPTLILAGRFDRALYPRLQMDFKRCAPQARFVMMEKSGSFSHLEEPDAVFSLLRSFLP
jgi:proline iminopeptidase